MVILSGPPLELCGDRDARAFETDALFVLRPDRQNSFCLPKRIMTEREIDLTRSIVAGHVKKFFRPDYQAPHAPEGACAAASMMSNGSAGPGQNSHPHL